MKAVTDKTAVSSYLKEVRALAKSSPVLSWADECRLSDAIEVGDRGAIDAANLLVTCNLRYVLKATSKYMGKPFYEDLIQEGNLGLMTAARKFSKNHGARFITYASWWVAQAMRKFLADNGRDVRLPTSTLNTIRKMNAIIVKIAKSGRLVTDSEVADLMGLPVKKVRTLSMWAQEPVSINAPVSDSEDSDAEFGDFIADMVNASPEENLMQEETRSNLDSLLSVLDSRERRIIEGRAGLTGEELSLEDLGNEFSISRERVRQIQAKAMEKLKKRGVNLGLAD